MLGTSSDLPADRSPFGGGRPGQGLSAYLVLLAGGVCHAVVVTNRIPVDTTPTPDTTQAFLADFSTIAVARDLAPSVKILDQTYGDYDQMAVRVVARMDAAPMLPEAIVVLRGITL